MQYGNAFGQGMQAAALKPADFFGNDDVLYLMEDMATGEIRLSILWEWLHKARRLHRGRRRDRRQGRRSAHAGRCSTGCCARSTTKLLAASNRDVHDDSKETTLPIAREIVEAYVTSPVKLPWYIDLLNLNLENADLDEARRRIRDYLDAFARGERLTANSGFGDATPLIAARA